MASRDPRRPNLVSILTDDQGPWALGCAGNHEIITPNLDALAASGTRYDSFFCTSPVCSPARASLLTGRMPSQHGVQDWISGGNDGPGATQYLEGQIAYTDVLAAAGYRCSLSGKWHLGDSATPQKSFEHWYAHQKGSDHYHNAPMYRDGKLIREPGYITDLITDDAIAFIEASAADDAPFYSSVHHTAPHSPWVDDEHPKTLRDLYRDCPFETSPQEPPHPDSAWRLNAEDARESLIGYYAAVTGVDRGVGRIVARLRELGLLECTLICFVGDNGFNCGHHGIWGKGNGTFRLNMYDTSVKVPAIFCQPGRIPGGVVSQELASGYDFMPTLLDYVGLEMPELGGGGRVIQAPGRSFAASLQGDGKRGEREDVVVYDEYGPVRMIRTREWKYVHRYPFGPHELYDLAKDPGERADRIDDPACRGTIDDLRARLEAWFVEHADPELDGARQPVTGNGQLFPVGRRAAGRLAFDQNRELRTDPRADPGMRR